MSELASKAPNNQTHTENSHAEEARHAPSSALICGFCADWFRQQRYFTDYSNDKLEITRPVEAFRLSAELGCPLCWWFMYGIYIYDSNEWHLPPRNGGLAPDTLLTFTSDANDFGWMKFFGPQSEHLAGKQPRLFVTEIVAKADNPAAQETPLRPTMLDVGTDETLSLAKTWLNEAMPSECPVLPTRVIDVAPNGNLQQMRLHICNGHESAHFICLSYCWGRGNQFRCTLANIDDLARFISYDALPRTIQDAVTCTRKLGFRYLWVDALCIIQDSEEDKLHEIANMGDIYSQATVTISAASASASSEGFLGKREDWAARDVAPIRLPWVCEYNLTGAVSLYHNTQQRIQDPIHTRAWTLQEQLLSARILAFTKQQMFFVNNGEVVKDPSVRQWAIPKMSTWEIRRPFYSKSWWNMIVPLYSPRNYTVERDRYLAIASVARQYSEDNPDDYLLGLWRKTLLQDLLWTRKASSKNKRHKQWRCASWSWMSISGPVERAERIDRPNDRDPPRLLFEIVKCEIIPTTPNDPYSLPAQAILDLNGILYAHQIDAKSGMLYYWDVPGKNADVESLAIGTVQFDTDDDVQLFEERVKTTGSSIAFVLPMFVIPLPNGRRDPVNSVVGLVLIQNDNESLQRVGIFRAEGEMSQLFHPDSNQDEVFMVPADDPEPFDVSRWATWTNEDVVRPVHTGVYCSGALCRALTKQGFIVGTRYTCALCKINLCQICKRHDGPEEWECSWRKKAGKDWDAHSLVVVDLPLEDDSVLMDPELYKRKDVKWCRDVDDEIPGGWGKKRKPPKRIVSLV